jgi:hypothetical protein
MLDESFVFEKKLDFFLVITILLVDGIKNLQVVFLTLLQRRAQFEETLLRFGKRFDEIKEFRAWFHRIAI